MNDSPLTLAEYPRAILHIDADAFFASVEQALNPDLRGKPVVTGRERGIIACASYEAKARGVRRGIPLFEARRMCPDLVVLPSDYESYSLYSRRMFNVMRTFSPAVEEYSIDEAFVDVTGLRRLYRASYEEIARRLQAEINRELGITVSVGLSLSKSLAKIGSKFRKPRGFTAVPGPYIHLLLQRTPLEKVWGFGPNTVALLEKHGLRNALDFTRRQMDWAGKVLGKPGREIWSELRGDSVWKVNTAEKESYGTILKSKTFTPPSGDRALVYAKLVRNAEGAFMKARRYRLRARAIGIALRRHDFTHAALEARLNRAASSPLEALPLIHALFDRAFQAGCRYRSTLIVLGALESDRVEQGELFEDRLKIESIREATRAIDALNARYGKHTVCSATSLFLARKSPSDRDDDPERWSLRFRGENRRQRLAVPRGSMRV